VDHPGTIYGRATWIRRGLARSARRRSAGFTLTEAVIVLCVIGILFAISMPAVSSYLRTSRLAGATNTLIGDMHYARSLAAMRRKTYEIRFASNAYTVCQVAPAATVLTRDMPLGVVCAASDTATFFAWGLAVPVAVAMIGGSDTTTVQLAANGSVTHD